MGPAFQIKSKNSLVALLRVTVQNCLVPVNEMLSSVRLMIMIAASR